MTRAPESAVAGVLASGLRWELVTRPDVTSALLAALDDEHPPVRNRAARALVGNRDPRLIPVYLGLLGAAEVNARARALPGLLRGVEGLFGARLDDPSARVRRVAVDGLRAVGARHDDLVSRVRQVLADDSDDEVRGAAARFIGEHDTRYWTAVGLLHRVLANPTAGPWARLGAVKGLAAQALVRGFAPVAASAPGIVNTLAALLDHPWPALRIAAVEALRRIGGPAAAAPLRAARLDPDLVVRAAVIEALVALRAPDAGVHVLDALRGDPEHIVREVAARVAAELGDPLVVDALRQALGNPSQHVRREAIQALIALEGTAALPALRASLRDDPANRWWNRAPPDRPRAGRP